MQKKLQIQTYLQQCLQNGKLLRWSDNLMPLKVYIAPFRFYSKVAEGNKYIDLVLRAFEDWEKASMGKISFQIVPTLLNSQINVDWKRVERASLGCCYFNNDINGRLYSAEVQIGLSDGIIHQDYMPEDEVYHTIIHEIGHSLGLGHSGCENDIMYTPHKIGVIKISDNDRHTLKWLYKFQSGATPDEIASKYGFHTSNLDDIVAHLIKKDAPSDFEKVKCELASPKRDLLQEQENIADLKKYNLELQGIKLPENIRKTFISQPYKQK